MDTGLILAILGSTVTIIGSTIAMMIWCRQETNSLRKDAQDDRRDFVNLVRNIEKSINEMKIENKDFHYRLLEIEKGRNKAVVQ